jgi:hypothetical protein
LIDVVALRSLEKNQVCVMGAKASYLLVCDPAPAGLGLITSVELLLINDASSNANDFRLSDNPNVFLNKPGMDIGSLTTELIQVSAVVTLEGNVRRSFRLYICIEGIPCVGVPGDPLQATVENGRALLSGTVRLGDLNQACGDFLDAMLKQEVDSLDAPFAGPLPGDETPVTEKSPVKAAGESLTSRAGSPKKHVTKKETAAIIKNLLNN